VEPDTQTPITGYAVEMDDNQDGVFEEIWNGRGYPEITSHTISTTTGQVYNFRHRAFNANGASDYSSELVTYSCTLPTAPGTPQLIEQTASSLTITWTDPVDDGGCDITEYKVYRDTGNGDAVTNEIHSADMAGKSYVNGLIVTELPGSSLGKSFKFIVKVFTALATDGVQSSTSDAFLLAGLPDAPASAPTRGASTSASAIQVSITAVAGTNGSPITSYYIEIDDGLFGSFVELQGYSSETTSLTATKSTGVTAGRTYRVRYRAKNAVGYGDVSPVGYILAAQIPDTPVPPTVTVSATNAIVSWVLPYNGGSVITTATVKLKQTDGFYSTELSSCDASSSPVFLARSCTIPLATLRTGPFSLSQGDSIISVV